MATATSFERIEITGVIPETEPRFHAYKLAAGRFLLADDKNAVVIEQLLADEFKLTVGDDLLVRHHQHPEPVRRMRIVGVVDRRRASVNQAPMAWAKLSDVQSLCRIPDRIKEIDVIVAEPGIENIRRIAGEIESLIKQRNAQREAEGRKPESIEVKTTEAQHQKLGAAQGLVRFIMMLLACCVLLTAFFIILSTMSMGVTERVSELGLLRCVGVTRRQLSGVLLLQTVPLGLAGTLLGLPLGFALQWLTLQTVPEYVGSMAVSRTGVLLGVLGGLGATLLGATVPALSAFTVSPVEAAHPHAAGRLGRWVWPAALVGLAAIAAHVVVQRNMPPQAGASFDAQALAGLVLLYGGWTLLMPAVVLLLGRLAVRVAAWVLRLRPQLLGDEIAKAPYRSAAICAGLMVGLSLIIGLVVWGKSVKQGWQFPKEFPDAMLYSYESLPLAEVRQVLASTQGISQYTVTDDFPFSLTKLPESGFLRALAGLDQFSRFLAIDPVDGPKIVKLTFVEGDEQEAIAKLRQGGHLLVTREFAQAQSKHVGDRLTIWVGKKRARFTIAGIVASPGLDIAISFFNATTYFQTYSVGAIIGTFDDAKRKFGREYGKLMLFNFSFAGPDESRIIADSSEAQSYAQPTLTAPSGRPTFALGAGPIPGDGPEERIANGILTRLGDPPKAFVTARELKHQIERNIDRVTLLLSAVPAVALIVAALGLANLMAANVASRSKQLAVLRAIGATRWQLVRIVMGEALVLGLIGSVMGLTLGIALGRTSNVMTAKLSGFCPEFAIPWEMVTAGAVLATGLCMLAALIPARYAGRSNIVAVLSDL